jgi:xanthine permease XanP
MTESAVASHPQPAPPPPQPVAADVIFRLGDRPKLWQTIVAALQHVSAVFVGVITPPLLISRALGLELADSVHIVGMSLAVSGIATFIQCRRFGPVGSGLLSIQGTSFTFLGPIIASGTAMVEAGMPATGALGVIFGVCLLGSPIEMVLSRFLGHARRIITPTVTGVVVTLIGLTLVKVGMTTMAGGPAARADGSFASLENLGLAGLVLLIIVVLNRSSNPYLRMSSIIVGLVVGYVVSIVLGRVEFARLGELSFFAVPLPLRYGIGFDWAFFLPIALLYLITTIETIGDTTATSAVSDEPVEGPLYMRRIQGAVLGDGVNSALAAIFNTFPNTTFSQNNGVIQLTGVASRYVGYYIAGFLFLLGLFPVIGGIFQIMPQPVLGGATMIMFGSVAAAGIRIIASHAIDRRAMLIIAISLALGLGITFVPEALARFPPFFRNMFQSGIATGGLIAIVLNVVLPREP